MTDRHARWLATAGWILCWLAYCQLYGPLFVPERPASPVATASTRGVPR